MNPGNCLGLKMYRHAHLYFKHVVVITGKALQATLVVLSNKNWIKKCYSLKMCALLTTKSPCTSLSLL